MFSDAQKLDYVAQSPVLCARHDRAGWVALFARDGQVNDPVGSRPHEGKAAIGRFYDTFIAPNRISFDVEHDIVTGMVVVRDLRIDTVMSTGLRIGVPMHIRYVLCEEDGALRIHRLYAHWELDEMLRQQRSTLKGLWTSAVQAPRMLGCQGISGVLGFLEGLRGVGAAGKQAALARIAGDPQFPGWTPHKALAAGNWVSVTLKRDGAHAVAMFRFDGSPDRIAEVERYA
jgi:hypothetical protein